MNTFNTFVKEVIKQLKTLDSSSLINYSVGNNELEKLDKDNFKVLAHTKLQGTSIGLSISGIGWSVVYGNIYTPLLSGDHEQMDPEQQIFKAKQIAQVFYDLANGYIPTVIYYRKAKNNDPDNEFTPLFTQFFEYDSGKYKLIATNFQNIENGWDTEVDNSKSKIIKTEFKKIISPDVKHLKYNQDSINTIRNLDFPFDTSLNENTNLLNLELARDFNEKISFKLY